MKVRDGSLRIRSGAAASGYVGGEQVLTDADGFVDTGDIVERRGDRLLFRRPQGRHHQYRRLESAPGRDRGGDQPASSVRMSLVRPKQNPITGAIVVADVVLEADGPGQKIERRGRPS